MKAPRVLLVGAGGGRDRHDHFGCGLVAAFLRETFKPVRSIPVGDPPDKGDVDGIDFVIVNAEGSTHHDRNSHLYRNWKRPAVMINGVWQDNRPVDLIHFLYVSVRESFSAKAMTGCNVKPEVVPDVMLMTRFGIEGGGGTVVSDSVVSGRHGIPLKREHLPTFLRADRLVCGRFHAACLALVTGKPFSCYPSNTHKTAGMMADAGLSSDYYSSAWGAIQGCPTEADPKAAIYVEDARRRIESMVARVRDLISQA